MCDTVCVTHCHAHTHTYKNIHAHNSAHQNHCNTQKHKTRAYTSHPKNTRQTLCHACARTNTYLRAHTHSLASTHTLSHINIHALIHCAHALPIHARTRLFSHDALYNYFHMMQCANHWTFCHQYSCIHGMEHIAFKLSPLSKNENWKSNENM